VARVSVLKPVAVACRPSRTSWLGEANTAWPADSVKSRSASGLAAGAGAGAMRAPAHARGSRTSGASLQRGWATRFNANRWPLPPVQCRLQRAHNTAHVRDRSSRGWPSSAACLAWSKQPPPLTLATWRTIHRAANRYACTQQPPAPQAHSTQQKWATPRHTPWQQRVS